MQRSTINHKGLLAVQLQEADFALDVDCTKKNFSLLLSSCAKKEPTSMKQGDGAMVEWEIVGTPQSQTQEGRRVQKVRVGLEGVIRKAVESQTPNM